MARLNVVAEGSTEESFVRIVLSPFLGELGVYTVARSVETRRVRGTIMRGGLKDYNKAKRDIVRWLKQDPSAFVTTMFDLYGLPSNFPGFDPADGVKPMGQVEQLERALAADIDYERFIPYIQIHEFESLLFSDVNAIDDEMSTSAARSRLAELRAVRVAFETPEHINEGYESCPSRRLSNIFPRYQKVTDGVRIASRIGISRMREECRHFSAWIDQILDLELTPTA